MFNISSLNISQGLNASKHHHGPKVMASNPEQVSLDEIIQEREKEISDVLKKNTEPVNDLQTMYNKLKDGHQFDEHKLRSQIVANMKNPRSKVHEHSKAGKKIGIKALHKGSTITCFFFVGTASILSVVLARKYHKEADQLHELNKIYHNPKARVVIGKDKGARVVSKMKKLVKQNKAKDLKAKKQRKAARISKKAPVVEEEKEDEEEPLNVN